MPIRRILFALLLSLAGSARAQAGFISAEQRSADFRTFCDFVALQYAYFDRHRVDWPRACAQHAPQAAAAADRTAYIQVLERALGELYDAHAILGVNTPASPRLAPSQTDVVAAWRGEEAVITDVRGGSAAALAGVLPGMVVLAVDGLAPAAAAAPFEPGFLLRADPLARHHALQTALAGRHDQPTLRLRVRWQGHESELAWSPRYPQPAAALTWKLSDGIAHLRVNNSLGDMALVTAFDEALSRMGQVQGSQVQAMVLDLRDTPSGGNTTVARGIMGRLVARAAPYQRHEDVSEGRSTGVQRGWVEWVWPRGTHFGRPVFVLVGPWTGSMGEGLAIGLNAARGAPVLGRPMARLLGGLEEITLQHSGIAVRVPGDKLFHVNGQPRENFLPCPLKAAAGPGDTELAAALAAARAPAARLRHCAAAARPVAWPAGR